MSESFSRLLTAAKEMQDTVRPDAHGWFPIETAPLGVEIWACDPSRAYEAKVINVNGEWECVSYDGFCMGIGFYPTFWHPLPRPPIPTPSQIMPVKHGHPPTDDAVPSGDKSTASSFVAPLKRAGEAS